MSLNYVGTPVGAAIAGVVATRSMEAALLLGVVSCLAAGGIAAAMIPPE